MHDFVHEGIEYTIRPLAKTDNVKKFSSSARNLNIFLRDVAFSDMQENETKTYVLASISGEIIGFYTVAISLALRKPDERSQGPLPVDKIILPLSLLSSQLRKVYNIRELGNA